MIQQGAKFTVFEYFPGNYVWNLSVVATLNKGGLIDEVDRACRTLLEAAKQGTDAGTELTYASWSASPTSSSRQPRMTRNAAD